MTAGMKDAAQRLKSLDGLRGVAVLCVIVCHFFPRPVDPADPLVRLYTGFVVFGYSGVDLFFVLSGFLITGILVANRGEQRYFVPFYARRILRIWPLYFLLCFVAIVVIPAVPAFATYNYFRGDFGSSAYYWLFLNNFHYLLPVRAYSFLAVCWSLAIEEQFYLVWPLLIWFISPRRLFYMNLVVVIVAALLRNVLYHGFGIPGEALYYDTFTHLDGLALGSLIAIAWADPQTYERTLNFLSLQLAVTAPALALVVMYSVLFPKVGLGQPNELPYQPLILTVGDTLTALFYGGILVRCVSSAQIGILIHPALLRVGKYSYAMYLLHIPAWYIGEKTLREVFRMGRGLGIENSPRMFVIGFICTYLLAALSWKILEGPMNALKSRFPYRPVTARRLSTVAPLADPPLPPR